MNEALRMTNACRRRREAVAVRVTAPLARGLEYKAASCGCFTSFQSDVTRRRKMLLPAIFIFADRG